MHFRHLWVTTALALLGCETDSPIPGGTGISGDSPPAGDTIGTLSFDPTASFEQVDPITAIEVDLPGPPSDDITPYVVEGAVSQASINRLKNGELTAVVAEKVIPSVVRNFSAGWRIRPEVALRPGETYSVVSQYGLHGSLRVGAPTYAVVKRVWPISTANGAVSAVFCGEAAPTDVAEISLEGTDAPALVLPGLNDDGLRSGSCVRLAWEAKDQGVLQPPTRISSYSLDPARLPSGTLPVPTSTLACEEGEFNFAVGCASVRGGEIVVRPPNGSYLWAMGWNGRFHLQTVEEGRRFVIPELGPERRVEMSVTVFDAAGRQFDARPQLNLPSPQAHIVINEVMANPLGPEPSQEWIEVLNAGSAKGDLSQLALRDNDGASVDLPPCVLEPGQYALLVRDDFELSAIESEMLPPDVAIVRLAHLSSNGLSNAGERLTLVTKQGEIASSFPPVAAKNAGVTVARRNGWSLDEDPESFAIHGSPGYSPGAPNRFSQ